MARWRLDFSWPKRLQRNEAIPTTAPGNDLALSVAVPSVISTHPGAPSPIERFRRVIGLDQDQTTAGKRGFLIAILYALACASFALRQAFASEFTLADDVREHVFWMFRFLDPKLFPNDPSADYFQSLAPIGYARLYWLLAKIGVDPLLAAKLIPVALSLVATAYFFGFVRRFSCSAVIATLTAILFTQSLWLNSDLSSATPRAFFYPTFVAFLYYEQRHSFIGIVLSIGFAALLFPPAALVLLGVLGLAIFWKKGPESDQVRDNSLFAAALIVSLMILLPYFEQTHAFGSVISRAQAERMPEFGPKGRVPFFFASWWGNWVAGNGGLHTPPTHPPWLLAGFLWPMLRKFPRQFPLLNSIPRGAWPVPQIIAASLTLFFLAHLFLFRLYLPNRYTAAVMRLLLVLMGGVILVAIMDGALRWGATHPAMRTRFRQTIAIVGCSAALAIIPSYPFFLTKFPSAGYIRGEDPNLYRFFSRQPADIKIASLSDEADNLPTFCRRSVVVGAECAIPLHPKYYLPLRERALQIARAQDSADPSFVEKVVRDEKVDFWLLDSRAFTRDYWQRSRLLRQLRLVYPALNLGPPRPTASFLQHPPPGSIAYQDRQFVVIDTHRLFQLGR